MVMETSFPSTALVFRSSKNFYRTGIISNPNPNPNLIHRNRTSKFLKGAQNFPLKIQAIDEVAGAADPVQAQVTWEIVVGALAGVTPFVVAGIEFRKRIKLKCSKQKAKGNTNTGNIQPCIEVSYIPKPICTAIGLDKHRKHRCMSKMTTTDWLHSKDVRSVVDQDSFEGKNTTSDVLAVVDFSHGSHGNDSSQVKFFMESVFLSLKVFKSATFLDSGGKKSNIFIPFECHLVPVLES
ncbi:hypothetical protein BVC80_613g9 [Macleaya cordata]|uniref:Uncharacterized protein n=1 Tax=Macleaya cordata TaxID=56857 RepID=A0A200QXC7_MACCD|nr:hypothetical protein BVC80_613g9 [Macleaya cordata]